MSSCNGCHRIVSVTEKITCSACSNVYHYACVSFSKENYNKLSTKTKSLWKCPECKLPRAKGDNSNTPVKEDAAVIEEPLQLDSLDSRFKQLESSIVSRLQSFFHSKIEALHSDVKAIPELVKTIDFLSGAYDEMNSELSKLKAETSILRDHNAKLNENVKELNHKLAVIEQQARECNLEIQCLPEVPKENLVKTVLLLGKVVSCPLEEKDVLSCTRVAKSNPKSTRPKSIIVKLPSTRMRDNLLAACLNYNKSHPKEKLHSALLGYGDERKQIYVSEHLSPSNRSLHAQARLFRKDNNYKYLWVRNGRILMRKDDQSPALWVRDVEALQALLK